MPLYLVRDQNVNDVSAIGQWVMLVSQSPLRLCVENVEILGATFHYSSKI